MICKYCGKEIDSASKYCKYCGNKVEKDDIYSADSQSLDGFYSNDFEKEHNEMYGVKPKKKRRPLLAIFLFLLAGIVAFFGYIFIDAFIEVWNEDYVYNDEYEDDEEETKIEQKEQDKDESSGWASIVKELDDNNPADKVQSTASLLTFVLSFDDVQATTDALDWYDFLYGEGYYDAGSVSDYYMECSKGAFTFVPAIETWGNENDGIIDMQLSMDHPSFNFTRSEDDYYEDGYELYETVLTAADDYVDFASYDSDGDGFITPFELTVVFVFAGYETYEEFDTDQTTYSCSLIYDYYLEIDGVEIDECIYSAEKDPYGEGDQVVGIGIMCHELGHALDLPDLYDTDYSSEGLGFHCLMAGGCDNTTGYDPYGMLPAPLTAWEREFLGFAEPEVITQSGTYSVFARSLDEYNILKIEAGDAYYLVENVDFEGFGKGLEDFLDSPGIAIWRVDRDVVEKQHRFDRNDVNDNEREYGVMLNEAHDTSHLTKKNFDYYKGYDHYHYLDGDNAFESEEGIVIEVLDNPQGEMEVRITLP